MGLVEPRLKPFQVSHSPCVGDLRFLNSPAGGLCKRSPSLWCMQKPVPILRVSVAVDPNTRMPQRRICSKPCSMRVLSIGPCFRQQEATTFKSRIKWGLAALGGTYFRRSFPSLGA